MSQPQALVLTGDGINCERETSEALELAGFKSNIIHINELLKRKEILKDYQTLALPGGFSFGDELVSGKVLALKIKHGLEQEFNQFICDMKLVIGICNGFQALCWLDIFKDDNGNPIRLMKNNHNKFINKWVEVKINNSNKSLWLKNLNKKIKLPVRHGEGRIQINSSDKENQFSQMVQKGNIALEYDQNINGSDFNIAGLCNTNGNVLGLMPHPEAATNKLLNPFSQKMNKEDAGLEIFKSGFKYFQ